MILATEPLDVLLMCEESQEVVTQFLLLGHNAYSTDLKQCSGAYPERHIQGDCFDAFYSRKKWDLIIAHPPCTYLTVTANRWLKDQPERLSGVLVGQARRDEVQISVDFVKRIWGLPCAKICIENPVGVLSSLWMQPTQIIQPMQFGHTEPKKTCLWLKGLPPLVSTTKRQKAEYITFKSGKRLGKWFVEARRNVDNNVSSENRSKTFEGIAKAMAKQWSTTELLTLF